MARSAECYCEYNFTCGYCCRNIRPYHFTPRTMQEIMHDKFAGLNAWADKRGALRAAKRERLNKRKP